MGTISKGSITIQAPSLETGTNGYTDLTSANVLPMQRKQVPSQPKRYHSV